MRRILRISDAAAAATSELLHLHRFSLPILLSNLSTEPDSRYIPTRWLTTLKPGGCLPNPCSDWHAMLSHKWVSAEARDQEELTLKVSELVEELIQNVEDDYLFERVLEDKGLSLFKIYSDGSALDELLKLLKPSPYLAIKVFNWRRRREDAMVPMRSEEYAKGIRIAGRMKNLDLAVEIFIEAGRRRLKDSSIYNALMGAYMYNGLPGKCQSVFQDLKTDVNCSPTAVTYNILISLFGQRLLIDQMEAMLQEMKDLNISPNITTYNNIMTGYLTAWMWDRMENTYHTMEMGTVQPDLTTHLLMLRGYAYSGNLEKMEDIYTLLAPHGRHKGTVILRAMICAYARSSCMHRVKQIEELVRLLPEYDYKPWLNVLLIRLYAQENLVYQMDRSIDEAFEHNTSVDSVKIMHCIVTCYFRNNALDRLANFVKRAGDSGWLICRSLFHCLLDMYRLNKRIDEMEQVLVEMERFNFICNKKTFLILHKAYSEGGYTPKMQRVLGLMCKYGYGIPKCIIQS